MNTKNNHKETTHKQIKIKGMICESCEKIIEKSVGKVNGVKNIKVNYQTGQAEITYNQKQANLEEISTAIKKAGYDSDIAEQNNKTCKNPKNNNNPAFIAIGIIALLLLIIGYFAASATIGKMNFSIPQLDANTSTIIIFFVGLLTGFHCIGMCGGFVLGYTAQTRKEKPNSLNLDAHAKYAIGKTLSYTLIGGLFGLIGSIFVFSIELRAIIAGIAGIFLILFGLKMLDAHPILHKIGIPQSIFNKLKIGKLKSNNNPLFIGLANGLFIACGPLQAMYILAMGTASPITGAMILLAFGLGTLIPLLGFGLFATFISRSMQNTIVRISGVIIIIMGILMINNGLVLSGTNITSVFATPNLTTTNTNNTIQNNNELINGTTTNGPGYQIIRMDVVTGGFSPSTFTLKTGVPVKWIINGKELTGCNNGIIVNAYKLNFSIKQGEQTIQFTPTTAGTINWSCWMGMIPGKFIVRDDVSIDTNGNIITNQQTQQQTAQQQATQQTTATLSKTGAVCECAMMNNSATQNCH